MEILVLVKMVILILVAIVFVLLVIILGKLLFIINNFVVQHVLELWKQIAFLVIIQLLIELRKIQTKLVNVIQTIILFLIPKYVLIAIILGKIKN